MARGNSAGETLLISLSSRLSLRVVCLRSDAAISAMGYTVNQAVVLGNFSNYVTENDLTTARAVCIRLANAAASGAPQLSQAIDLEDLVGIFAIQARLFASLPGPAATPLLRRCPVVSLLLPACALFAL